jgi:hypothetical protein
MRRAQNREKVMLQPITQKEHTMSRGHCTGRKKERKGASDWYKKYGEENIRRVEAEWQARQQEAQQQ